MKMAFIIMVVLMPSETSWLIRNHASCRKYAHTKIGRRAEVLF